MTINLNNSATDKIPPSDKICPLVQWILMSTAFIIFALFEYFLILIVLRFWDKVGSNIQIFKYSNIQRGPDGFCRWGARERLRVRAVKRKR